MALSGAYAPQFGQVGQGLKFQGVVAPKKNQSDRNAISISQDARSMRVFHIISRFPYHFPASWGPFVLSKILGPEPGCLGYIPR